MQRLNRHKVKKEIPEASTSFNRKQEEHDLTYYIHDRVELMHQVFSILKSKEIKMLAPECVRHISMDNLQELCTEELLGISSKRLHAILDGAEPPSDTESSSQSPSPQLETISLDSISSDEEILSQHSGKKKKHKHRRRNSKKRNKEDEDEGEKSRASRAGLTVLELLELQARARAIRAQLQQDQALKRVSESAVQSDHNSSENEVEIKEEPAEVVEISSDEEKPRIEELDRGTRQSPKLTEQPSQKIVESQPKPLTRKVNDLVITVPQTKTTKKIKLKRNNKTALVAKDIEKDKIDAASTVQVTVCIENPKNNDNVANSVVEVQKKSKKKKKKKRTSNVEEVDNDEITLQLSDSEKMDLLESLERRKVASSEDSVSSSDSESIQCNSLDKTSGKSIGKEKNADIKDLLEDSNSVDIVQIITNDNNVEVIEDIASDTRVVENVTDQELSNGINKQYSSKRLKDDKINRNFHSVSIENMEGKNNELNKASEDNFPISDTSHAEVCDKETEMQTDLLEMATVDEIQLVSGENDKDFNESKEPLVDCTAVAVITKDVSSKQAMNSELSDGEVTDRDSSEVEAVDLQPEIVCLSEEETEKKKKHKKEKKAKKEKKSKREKKNKKTKSDFREGADQNFYKNESNQNGGETVKQKLTQSVQVVDEESIMLEDEELQEILELSDDSSCYEVDGTALSKEPTADEIEALSAKIDEIEREDVVTQEQIIEYEKSLKEKESNEDIENISWKDRYLNSKKVKNVLITSSIFNAMRKKNKELRKKIHEANEAEETKKVEEGDDINKLKDPLEEGSIEHYKTLQGSTRYVDPVAEVTIEPKLDEDTERGGESMRESRITKEMRKDAKVLLKMYKKLLKYNDMERKRDPLKSKKKKKHKTKKREGDVSGSEQKNIVD